MKINEKITKAWIEGEFIVKSTPFTEQVKKDLIRNYNIPPEQLNFLLFAITFELNEELSELKQEKKEVLNFFYGAIYSFFLMIFFLKILLVGEGYK